MSRRAAGSLALIVAVVTAALTLATESWISSEAEPSTSGQIVAEGASPSTVEQQSPPRESTDPVEVSFATSTRDAVDWSALYSQLLPSLVSIATNEGGGSGFFVSEQGHILTNLHVLGNDDEASVYVQSGDRLDAELIAKDVGNDLALLQVDDDDLEIVVPIFGQVDELQIGEPVGAMGAPFGLPNTLTVGIISGLDRTRPNGTETLEPLRDMIQTDAALNPGNSGGMLIDSRGRVIGVPTQIQLSADTTPATGIGFAVGIGAILRSLPIMLEGDDVERGYLGISLDISGDTLSVSDVTCGSPADRAGMRDGDRFLTVNGESTETFGELTAVMATVSPGDLLRIVVRRGLREMTLRVTAGSWPAIQGRSGCG